MPKPIVVEKSPALIWNEIGMPEHNQEDAMPFQSLKIHFRSAADRDQFAELLNQKLTDRTKSVWFPPMERKVYKDKAFLWDQPTNPLYPVYVISKGRWETPLTIRALQALQVPFHMVVEPQEADQYATVLSREQILVLPFSNLGQGSIPARNWVWEHAIASGAERHWIIDDNIRKFYRLFNNAKTPVGDGTIFRAAEYFVDQFENVPMAGFNYHGLVKHRQKVPAFYQNTRVYSCILLTNRTDKRWRGRYNEDTDLSLRFLKDGDCTVLFNTFLAEKLDAERRKKGGNTDELYQGEGRRLMAESLKEQHPDVTTVTFKWNRWQHQVDYRPFKSNQFRLKSQRPEPMSGLNQTEVTVVGIEYWKSHA